MKKVREQNAPQITGFKLSIGKGWFSMELGEVDARTLIQLMSSARRTLTIVTIVAVVTGSVLSDWGKTKVSSIYSDAMRKLEIYLRAP